MQLNKWVRLTMVVPALISLSVSATPVLKRNPHGQCDQLGQQTEHYKTCNAYPAEKVRELEYNAEPGFLNKKVQDASEDELLIIPATSKDDPYLLTSPLKLKKGMGLLATGSGNEGFFYLEPADSFSIGADAVYCLVNLHSSNLVTGLAIDGREFSPAALSGIQSVTVPVALVYTQNNPGFSLTWSNLYGLEELTANIWVDNLTLPEDHQAVLKISRSWIETGGARAAIRITGSKADNEYADVNLQHLVVKISGETDARVQRGVWLKKARGKVEHNYFTMDETRTDSTDQRILLTLEDLYDSSDSHEPTITENYFHSPKEMQDGNDIALQFLQNDKVPLEALVFANTYTSNLIPSYGNSLSAGKRVRLMKNYQQATAALIPTREEFFGGISESVTWPWGGICFTPQHALVSGNETATELGSNRTPEYLCGSALNQTEFNLNHAYEGGLCLSAGMTEPLVLAESNDNCTVSNGLLAGAISVSFIAVGQLPFTLACLPVLLYKYTRLKYLTKAHKK